MTVGWNSPEAAAYAATLVESFRRITALPLLPDATDLAAALWHHPNPVVSHGTEADPIFRYGNAAALALWQMSWADFIRLPSRHSAEADGEIQSDRAALLARALQTGFVADYQGIRVSALGQRFLIRDTILWTVTDRSGQTLGQAALIGRVEPL